MKVAVLMGSPRKNDSYSICKEIMTHMKIKESDFNFIHVSDANIEKCKGCEICFNKSEKLCPIDDDVLRIVGELKESDAILFSSPVYAYHIPGQMKNFIDRVSYLFHRPELLGKASIIITTSNGGGNKEVEKYLKMTSSAWGLELIGTISIISPLYFQGKKIKDKETYDEKYHQKQFRRIKKLSEDFKLNIENDSPKYPSFYDIFIFQCLKSKTYTSHADYNYWKERGWLENKYFIDINLSPIKKLFSKIISFIVKRIIKRVYGL